MGVGLIITVVAGVVLIGLLGLIGFAVARSRAGRPPQVSLAGYLTLYVHIALLLSLVVTATGAVQAVNAGLSRVIGAEFSYGREHAELRPLPPPRGAAEPAVVDPGAVADADAREARRLDEAFRTGLSRGIALAIAGGVIYLIHFGARRALGSQGPRRDLRLAYLSALLAVFGLVSVIAIPVSIAGSLEYVVQESREYFSGPGADAAIAIVFAPVWLALIGVLLREVRRRPA